MVGDSCQQLTCNLGATGKLIRRALVTRSAPPDFREALRRQLFDRAAQFPDMGVARSPGTARYNPGGNAARHRL